MTLDNRKRFFALAVAFVALVSATPLARSGDDHEAKVKEAASQSVKAGKVFDEIMQTPDKAIPRDLLARAKAIAVFPQVHKAAFIFGGEGGRGVVSRRMPGWGWQALNGALSSIMGILIMAQWPVSGLWAIGLFVGIDLIYYGSAWIALALNLHKM